MKIISGQIKDNSYQTVRNGLVVSYSGDAAIEIDGRRYIACGQRPKGTAEVVTRQGYVALIDKSHLANWQWDAWVNALTPKGVRAWASNFARHCEVCSSIEEALETFAPISKSAFESWLKGEKE